MPRLIAATAALFLGAGLAAPASAQDEDYRVNQLIVYGDDECPASTTNEITVCARKEENERYRIPEDLRLSEDPANKAWTERVLAYEMVGRDGINSCTPVGGGGELGCTQQLIDKAYAERGESASIRFSELIAKAREERLSTIDQEAAAEQARVEEIEQQYADRAAAEAASDPGNAGVGDNAMDDDAQDFSEPDPEGGE